MTNTTNPEQNPRLPIDLMTQSIETVKQLVAAGLVDAKALGLPDRAPVDVTVTDKLPTWFMVPGDPITIRDLVAKTKLGLQPSTGRAYGCYLDLLADGYTGSGLSYPGIGDMLAHEVLPSHLNEALAFVQARALKTAEDRAAHRETVKRTVRESTGDGACYNAVGAWRRAFKVAVDDRHLARQFNPAKDIEKPRRISGKRRPLRADQMSDFWTVVRGTGNDPELDWMLCLTVIISGARREGLLNLTLRGLDRDECTVRLDEKFDKVVAQPVPDWFVQMLFEFATSRGARRPSDPVFRLAPAPQASEGKPITSRRLDYLFQRVQATLTWADKEQVTAHTLRHHAIALVERHAGKQVATAFARHEPEDTNGLYGRASDEEVARAVVELHGGDHPWLHRRQEG